MGLPSWVPDYGVNYIYSIGGSATTTSAPWSAAGEGSHIADITFSESDTLSIREYLLNIVKSDTDADLSELDEVAVLLEHVKLEAATRAMEDMSTSESTEDPALSGSMSGQSVQNVTVAGSQDHDHRKSDDLETAFRQRT